MTLQAESYVPEKIVPLAGARAPIEPSGEPNQDKERVFAASDAQINGLKLRPFSAGSLAVLRMTKNPLLDQRQAKKLAPSERERHVLAFLFVHAGDEETVTECCDSQKAFNREVLRWAFKVKVTNFIKATRQIDKLIADGMVGLDYEVKGDGHSPPN